MNIFARLKRFWTRVVDAWNFVTPEQRNAWDTFDGWEDVPRPYVRKVMDDTRKKLIDENPVRYSVDPSNPSITIRTNLDGTIDRGWLTPDGEFYLLMIPDDVYEMDDKSYSAYCCRCCRFFELDMTIEEIDKHTAKPVFDGWYCGRDERCCP